MSTFAEFDLYLVKSFSPDNWSDSGIEYATELIRDFSTSDWEQLVNNWRLRPAEWQVRAAEVLGWGDLMYAGPTLVAMIELGADEVAIAAADTLREFDRRQIQPYLTPTVNSRLDTLAQNHGGLVRRVITDLLSLSELRHRSQ